jgi:Putative porin
MEKKMSRFKCLVLAVLIFLPLPAWAADDLTDLLVKKGTITKEEADTLQKRSIAPYIDSIKFYGDLRIREESFWYSGSGLGSKDKNRQRFRLRIGTDITEGPVIVHIRVASGTGQQVSTNQTMENLSQQKNLWIDKAYVEYVGVPNLDLMAGRMSNPFYVNWLSGEIVFDDDYNPEGFAQQYSLKLGENGKLFANLGQVILDNGDAGSNAQWLMGYQVGAKMKMDPVDFNMALLYYNLANGTKNDFGAAVFQDGNTRTDPTTCYASPQVSSGCQLVNAFNVIDVTVGATFQVGLPITISADYVENLADTIQQASPSNIKDQTTAFGIGFKVGGATKAKTSEFAYTYRSIETDATLADINDSDFGPNGGTNREGHSVWVAYNPTDGTQVKLKYINSKVKDDNLQPAPISSSDKNPTFNRIQLDFSVKF